MLMALFIDTRIRPLPLDNLPYYLLEFGQNSPPQAASRPPAAANFVQTPIILAILLIF
jgi:hypothetical protein